MIEATRDDLLASADAEFAVLGALMLDNRAFDRLGALQPDQFFLAKTRTVAVELWRQIGAGKSCDVLTIGDALKAKNEIETVGGLQSLHSMTSEVSGSSGIERHSKIIIDRARSRALLAASREIGDLALDHLTPIAERIDAAQSQIMTLADDNGDSDWSGIDDLTSQFFSNIEAAMEGRVKPIPTGIGDIDELLDGGFTRGNLIIIGARPSMGKTALAMTFAVEQARDYSTGFMSMEMTKGELIDRAIAMTSRISLGTIKRPANVNAPFDHDAAMVGLGKLQERNLRVLDAPNLTLASIRTKARQLRRKHGLDVLYIDYLGLMQGMDKKMPRHYQIEEITQGLKTLAKQENIAIVLLVQLNRATEGKHYEAMPMLSDLKDSGAIEQDADVVLFIHRPMQVKQDLPDDWANYAKCSVAKNRQGACGLIDLCYIGEQTRFGQWEGGAPFIAVEAPKSARFEKKSYNAYQDRAA